MRLLAAVLLIAAVGCDARRPPPRQLREVRELPAGWWRATCGEVPPLRVGHDVTPPVLVERVEPRWPKRRRRGVIIIAAVLTADGNVCAARILRGLDPELDRAALDAVRQWRFTPVRRNGVARAAFYNLSIPVE